MYLFIVFLITVILILYFNYINMLRKLNYINYYNFSTNLKNRLKSQLNISEKEMNLILHGLKDFFKLYSYIKKPITMPTKSIDAAWHIFLEDKKEYDNFCKNAFGKRLKHNVEKNILFLTLENLQKDQKTQNTYNFLKKIEENKYIKNKFNFLYIREQPFLFLADLYINMPNGNYYNEDLFKILENNYIESKKSSNSSGSSSGCSSCSSCGGGGD